MQPTRFKLVSGVFILLLKDNKIFLSKRINTGYNDGLFSIVGGHMEGNETAREACAREVFEETGAKINVKNLKFVNICHIITNDERMHISFTIDKWEGEVKNNEPEKASEAGWFPLDNLPENLTSESKATIDWYKKGVTYSEFGWEKK